MPTDPLEDDTIQEDDIAQTDQNITTGLDKLGFNPAQMGKIVDASAKLKQNTEVLRHIPQVSIDDILERDKRKKVLARNTALAKWMAQNPLRSTIAWDDAEGLDAMYRSSKAWMDAAANRPTTGDKWRSALYAPVQGVIGGVGSLSSGIYGLGAMATTGETSDWFQQQAQAGKFLASGVAQTFGGDEQTAERVSRWNPIQTRVMGIRLGTEEVAGVVPSLAPTVLAGLVSGGSAWAIAAAAGAQSAGGMYSELGADPNVTDARAKSLLAGAITASITKFIPGAEGAIGRMLRNSPNPAQVAKTIFARSIAGTAVSEMSQEGLDQFAQSLIQGKSLRDSVAEALNAGILGGITGGVLGIGGARQARRMAHANADLATHEKFEALSLAFDSAKTTSRSVDTAKNFLQSTVPEITKQMVHLDAEVVAPLLADPKVAAELESIGLTRDKVMSAENTGKSLPVSMLDLITGLPPATRNLLADGLRFTADGMTKAEATKMLAEHEKAQQEKQDTEEITREKQYSKDMQAQVKRLVDEQVALGVPPEAARASLQPLIAFARSALARDPAFAKAPLTLLKQIKFEKGFTPEEARKQVASQVENIKGVVSQSALPQGVSARLDPLTGMTHIDSSKAIHPEQVRRIIESASGAKPISLAGKTIKVQDEAGRTLTIDAEEAIGIMRRKMKSAALLAECLG